MEYPGTRHSDEVKDDVVRATMDRNPTPTKAESWSSPMGPLPERRNATVVSKTVFTGHKRTSLGTP